MKATRIVTIGLALLSPLVVFAGQVALKITLEPSIELPAGQALTLGAIASFEGTGSERAAKINLGHVPGPGQRRALSRVKIVRALEAAGFSRGSVELAGASQPRVLGRGQRIDELRVRAAIEEAIAGSIPGGRVRIVEVQLPAKVEIEPGEYTVRVSPRARALRSGMNRIPLDIITPAGDQRRVGVYVRLELAGPVLVAARDVPRGERVRPRDLRLETRAFPSGAPVLHELSIAVGKVARSTLRTGEPIRSSALAVAHAVETGQTVSAIFRQGGVALTLETRARGKGEVGSIIPIAGVDGHSSVQARIVAPGKVVVMGSEETGAAVERETKP